jgi:hypothetical protein
LHWSGFADSPAASSQPHSMVAVVPPWFAALIAMLLRVEWQWQSL